MTTQPTAQTVGEQLRALVARVRAQATIAALSTPQIATGRQRTRLRVPGSSRHLADVITARRGPAGVVRHVRIAGALRGHPAHALDEILVLAIVEACHDLCGIPVTGSEIQRWQHLVRRAASPAHPAAGKAAAATTRSCPHDR